MEYITFVDKMITFGIFHIYFNNLQQNGTKTNDSKKYEFLWSWSGISVNSYVLRNFSSKLFQCSFQPITLFLFIE